MAVSPNGRHLYATSEVATATGTQGTLSTIDLRRAEEDPSRSVTSTVWAGCAPVRVVASKSSVYVTARGSDELLAFSAANLVANPGSALVGHIGVGESPVGLALVDHDERVIVADSNRFDVNDVNSTLAVVSAAGNGSLELLGYLTAGGFPRDMVVSPNGESLVVCDFDSGDIEDLDVSTLP
jgi:DNA-binding beta-propeller fold protein YncE